MSNRNWIRKKRQFFKHCPDRQSMSVDEYAALCEERRSENPPLPVQAPQAGFTKRGRAKSRLVLMPGLLFGALVRGGRRRLSK